MDSTATIDDTSAERAQRQLETLRETVESRLAALEAVLADPMRGESIEGLILDLARVTSEEARATAVKAALDARLEAEARVANAQSVAQESINEQRSAAEEARRSAEQMRERMATLEQTQAAQLRTLRETLEAEVARERETRVRFERAAAESDRQLATERAGAASLRKALENNQSADTELRQALEAEHKTSEALRKTLESERFEATQLRTKLDAERSDATGLRAQLETERAAAATTRETAERSQAAAGTLAREKAEAWMAQEALTADLAREREASSKLQRQYAELQAQLQLERAMSAELRQTAEQTQQQLSSVSSDKDQVAASVEELQRDLAAARSDAEVLRTDLAASGARLELLDGERIRADRSAQDLEARVETLTRELEEVRAEASRAAARALETSQMAGGFAPTPAPVAPPPPVVQMESAPAAETPAPAAPKTDSEWSAVRLAVRYSFPEPIAIQVNGDSGVLVDLSVAGCQLVTPSAVRPNQAVKVLLPSADAPIVCTGRVMWARFEPKAAGGAFGYRAGVQFTKPDQAALEGFIAASRPTR